MLRSRKWSLGLPTTTVSRLLLSLVLVCSVVFPLLVPVVRSQGAVTFTNVQASTSALVTVGYSTSQRNVTVTQMMSYSLEPYGYDTPSGSFGLTQIMESTGGWRGDRAACAYYDYFLFYGVKGHVVRGHFEAYNLPPYAMREAPLNFLILTNDQVGSFKGSGCGFYGSDYMFATYAYSYDLTWVVPADGVYAFMFFSTNLPYYGTIKLTASDLSTVTQSAAFTYTSTMVYTFQSTQLLISTQPNVTSQPSSSNYNQYMWALVVVAAIIILGLVMVKRRTKPKP